MSKFHNLLGFPYELGSHDCFSVLRSYYREHWDIHVPNHVRPTDFWEDPLLDLYQKHYARYGFEVVTQGPPVIGDLFLMPLATQINTHAAALVETNTILHHLPNQISCLDRLMPKWWGRVMVHLRNPLITAAQQGAKKAEAQHVHKLLDNHIFRDPRFQEAAARIEAERSVGTVRSDRVEGRDPGDEEPLS